MSGVSIPARSAASEHSAKKSQGCGFATEHVISMSKIPGSSLSTCHDKGSWVGGRATDWRMRAAPFAVADQGRDLVRQLPADVRYV